MNDLSRDLLDTIKGSTALFFEKLVEVLITKMGYGGSSITTSISPKPNAPNTS